MQADCRDDSKLALKWSLPLKIKHKNEKRKGNKLHVSQVIK